MSKMSWYVPIKVVSSGNIREHWAVKKKREDKYVKELLEIKPQVSNVFLPCEVNLTRVAPRKLDIDNLLYSFKKIRDTIADFIVPNLRPGQADSYPGLTFSYDQRKGSTKEYAIIVTIIKDEKVCW
jgi:hypothetical protein